MRRPGVDLDGRPGERDVLPSHFTPTTVPATLPQVAGGVTVNVTLTGLNWYGVLVCRVSSAFGSPAGWCSPATRRVSR